MKKNGMKSARWEILATDAEESGTTPGNVPQPKVRAKAREKGKSKGKGFDGARAEKSQWPGKGKSTGIGEGQDWIARSVLWKTVSMAIVLQNARKLKPRKKLCK